MAHIKALKNEFWLLINLGLIAVNGKLMAFLETCKDLVL